MKYIKSFNESLDFKPSRSRIFIRNYKQKNPGTDLWHILTEMGYKEWQNDESDVNTLTDMIDFASKKYGELGLKTIEHVSKRLPRSPTRTVCVDRVSIQSQI